MALVIAASITEACQSHRREFVQHCATKAGTKADFIRLEQIGIKGNGHMMVLEKNNLDVAQVLSNWTAKAIK